MKKIITLLLLPVAFSLAKEKPRPELPPELKQQADAIHQQVKAATPAQKSNKT